MIATTRTSSEIASDALDQLDVCREVLRQMESVLWTLKTRLGACHDGRVAELAAAVALDRADIVEEEARIWRRELEDMEVSA
jgi:hypothetical protein